MIHNFLHNPGLWLLTVWGLAEILILLFALVAEMDNRRRIPSPGGEGRVRASNSIPSPSPVRLGREGRVRANLKLRLLTKIPGLLCRIFWALYKLKLAQRQLESLRRENGDLKARLALSRKLSTLNPPLERVFPVEPSKLN